VFWLHTCDLSQHKSIKYYTYPLDVIILTFAMQLQLAFCSTEDWVKVRNWTWCHNISSYSLQHTAKNYKINPLNAELNPICYLLALLGAHHFLHISRIRVKLLLTIWAKHASLIWRDPGASLLTFWQNILLSPSLSGSYEKVLTTYQITNCSNSWRQNQMFLWNYCYYIPNYTVS